MVRRKYSQPDAYEYAALQKESEGKWYQAQGFWNRLIGEFGERVSKDRLLLWQLHRDDCKKYDGTF